MRAPAKLSWSIPLAPADPKRSKSSCAKYASGWGRMFRFTITGTMTSGWPRPARWQPYAVAAVRGGASWIQGTINGMGERAGNADIAEIALALRCLYDVPVILNLEKVREVSEVVQRAGGYTLEAWKPLVGQNLFMRESGAVASQFHLPEAIEPYSAEIVQAERRIVLGKKSGLDSIDLKCRELGVMIAAEQRGPVLAAVKKAAVSKRT